MQRYVTDPLLLEGRKFHLRLYLVISSLDPLRVLVFREGLLLMSSKNWSADPSLYADRRMQFSNSAVATNTDGILGLGLGFTIFPRRCTRDGIIIHVPRRVGLLGTVWSCCHAVVTLLSRLTCLFIVRAPTERTRRTYPPPHLARPP